MELTTNLCECGCGMEVNHGKRFVRGHNGKPHSHKSREAMSKAHKGVSLSPAHCAAIARGKMGHSVSDDTRESQSTKMKAYYANSERRDEMSILKMEYYKNHPETAIEHSIWMSAPENREVVSERSREYWADPKHRAEASKRTTEQFTYQSVRDALSKTMKNSDAHKTASEKTRGGNDIVLHHYTYDHADLSKYTMKITRSKHARLHNLLRRAGIEVPHIYTS